jgi:hypothetical protein
LFGAPGHVFDGTDGVGSRYFFACLDKFSAVPSVSGPVFIFCANRSRFPRYRGRRVPFSSCRQPDSFSTVPRASGPILMFCAPGLVFGGRASYPIFMFCASKLIFGGTEGVESGFQVLRFRTGFRRYGGVRARFHVLRAGTRFRRYRGCRVPFSYFALPESFPRYQVCGVPVFIFCAP